MSQSAAKLQADLPGAVLFACNLNCVRSPMAAALLRKRFGDRIFVDSCGIEAADCVDPFVAAVLAEQGLDVTRHAPKSFEALDDGSFDLVVTLTPEAHRRAEALSAGRAMEVERWQVSDPTLAEGGREQRLSAYRGLAKEIEQLIEARFGRPSTTGA